jgi:hypothetical protein
MSRAGVLPMLVRTWLAPGAIREIWSVPSKQPGGPLYLVHLTRTRDATRAVCDCEAANHARPCWHVQAALLAHYDLIPVDVATPLRYRPKKGN